MTIKNNIFGVQISTNGGAYIFLDKVLATTKRIQYEMMQITLKINPDDALERRLVLDPTDDPKKPKSKHDMAMAQRP